MEIKDKQVAYHDWEADHYDDKWSISFDQRCIDYAHGRYLRAVPDGRRYDRVLEIGCGTGFFLLNLAQAGVVGEAWCSDISPRMVAACAGTGARLGIGVRGCVADAEALPFADSSFDLVVGHAVAHHLPDVEGALKEVARVLRPGGRLLIAGEPTRTGDRIANWFKRGARVGAKLAAVVAGTDRVLAAGPEALPAGEREAAALETEVDLHCFAPAELAAMARDAGFLDVRVETEELTANWFGWTTRTLEAMLRPELVPAAYRMWAYRTWQRLCAFDERFARRAVPAHAFYNAVLTGVTPPAD